MAATHNYYRILGVPSTAGVPEIRNAVSALRKRDAAGSYTATLNTIEETLSDPQKRNAYDDQLGLTAGLRCHPGAGRAEETDICRCDRAGIRLRRSAAQCTAGTL